jgi:hypothetical protein
VIFDGLPIVRVGGPFLFAILTPQTIHGKNSFDIHFSPDILKPFGLGL